MAITFDGPNKLAILSAGTTMLDVPDLYSRWKDWLLAGNAQYLPAFSSVGGDPIDPGSGTAIPFYDFLINGWHIRPQEADHTLNVVNGILLVEGGGDPFVDTIGDFTVRINYQQPVQAITVDTGGAGGATAAEVWAYGNRTLTGTLDPTAAAIASAVVAALQGETIPVNIKKVNDIDVAGAGTESDPWGP